MVIIEIILSIAIVLMPYKLIGDELGSIVLMIIGSSLLLKYKSVKGISRIYTISLALLCVAGVASLQLSQNYSKSLGSLTIFINAFIFYLVFSKLKPRRDNLLKYIVYITTLSSLAFSVYQGVFLKKRIDGNFGYANTYALILLISLYLSEFQNNLKHLLFIQITLILAILYTGSRNTLVYLIIFLAYKIYHDIKNKNELISLSSFLLSTATFILLQYGGFLILLILPILFLGGYYFAKNSTKIARNVLLIILGAAGGVSLFFINSNYIERIKNISVNLGVFQERLVYFQDAIAFILKNPLGAGLNTFEYKQYLHQTAFYDVKYLHNSVLQAGYEMGLIGMILFITIAVLGLKLIIQSRVENKPAYVLVYITTYLHSLLDFDFSYASVFIITAMLVAFADGHEQKAVKNIPPAISLTAMLLGCYLLLVNAVYMTGDRLLVKGNLEAARQAYSINKAITLRDPDVYTKLADSYNLEYQKNKNSETMMKVTSLLEESERLNPYDPRIKGNLAFSYEKLGNPEKTMYYYESFFEIHKYYDSVYKLYYNYLYNQHKAKGSEEYLLKIDRLKERYNSSLKSLNPRAKFMKDQLPASFEELVNSK